MYGADVAPATLLTTRHGHALGHPDRRSRAVIAGRRALEPHHGPNRPKDLLSENRAGLIGAVLVAIGPVSMALYTPAMPAIAMTYGVSTSAVKATLTAYFGGFALAQLVAGPLSDALGRRPVTLAFLGIYLAASLAGVFAPTIEVLLAARLLQGIGAAVGVVISRAMVRDLFDEARGARIMNLVGIILAVAPAMAPTLGGMMLAWSSWHAIFYLMIGYGIIVVGLVMTLLPETVERDLARLRPRAVLRSYMTLLASPAFLFSALTLSGAVGALYAQATILPFLLMQHVGLSPAGFGLAMLLQTGSFFIGALLARHAFRIGRAALLVPAGLVLIVVASLAIVAIQAIWPPTLAGIMGPVALYACGIAFVMPGMTAAALRPFPQIAGAASALSGFLQMGTGFLGGTVAAMIGDPPMAMAIVVPSIGIAAALSWLAWRRVNGS